MTKRISSAEDAISALKKFKSRSAVIRVGFSFANGGLGFEGRVLAIDDSILQITGAAKTRDFTAPLLTLGPLEKFTFSGELIEKDSAFSLLLLIKRQASEEIHVHLSGEWPVTLQHQFSHSVN